MVSTDYPSGGKVVIRQILEARQMAVSLYRLAVTMTVLLGVLSSPDGRQFAFFLASWRGTITTLWNQQHETPDRWQ